MLVYNSTNLILLTTVVGKIIIFTLLISVNLESLKLYGIKKYIFKNLKYLLQNILTMNNGR